MDRYTRYFLQHQIWLKDEFCSYYVQDRAWALNDIWDVPCVIYDFAPEAEQWLYGCLAHDSFHTISQLRDYLCEDALYNYQVHKMDDHQVIRAAAEELTRCVYRIVIKPNSGFATGRLRESKMADVVGQKTEQSNIVEDTFDRWIKTNPHERLGVPRQRNMWSRETKRQSLEFLVEFRHRLGYQATYEGKNLAKYTIKDLDNEYLKEREEQRAYQSELTGILMDGGGIRNESAIPVRQNPGASANAKPNNRSISKSLGSEPVELELKTGAKTTLDVLRKHGQNSSEYLKSIDPDLVEDALILKKRNTDFDTLTDDEFVALHAYTSEYYQEINPLLRSEKINGTPWESVSVSADSALKKLSTIDGRTHNGYSYRGIVDMDDSSVQKLFKKGEHFSDSGFMSSSSKPTGSFGGDVEIKIKSITGVEVHDASAYPSEAEVLFKPKTEFQVKDCYKTKSGNWKVELEEL